MELDEQTEAALISEIKKQGGIELRDTMFKVRKDFYTNLIARGIPARVVDKIVGKLRISIPEKGHGSEIYLSGMQTATQNIYDLWHIYTTEMSEGLFMEICDSFQFQLPIC